MILMTFGPQSKNTIWKTLHCTDNKVLTGLSEYLKDSEVALEIVLWSEETKLKLFGITST